MRPPCYRTAAQQSACGRLLQQPPGCVSVSRLVNHVIYGSALRLNGRRICLHGIERAPVNRDVKGWRCIVFLLLALGAPAAQPDARRFFEQAARAEQKGDLVRAYLLYSQAVALDPYNLEYWRRRELLRTPFNLQVNTPAAATPQGETTVTPAPELRQPLPPVELRALPVRLNFDLRGDARTLFTEVARAFGLEAVFDSEYVTSGTVRFQIQDAGYREALWALEAATNSFVVPLSERRLLVARDNPQKRADLEPAVTLSVPVPAALSPQEAADVQRAVQQTLVLTRVAYDSRQGTILIRDRWSRAWAARELVSRLVQYRPQISLEVEFIEQSAGSSTGFGAFLPYYYPLALFGRPWNSSPNIPAGFSRFLTFGGGASLVGLGLAGAQAFARYAESQGYVLFRTHLRTLDGQTATLHVGDRFPVVTGRFIDAGASSAALLPSAINFEDLGLSLKVTPRLNDKREITMEIEAEFKTLTGEFVDEMPVIGNRRLASSVRLRSDEWAVLAGLMNSSEARTISGLAGLARIPVAGALLRGNSRNRSEGQVLLILKPVVEVDKEQSAAGIELWAGSEARPRIPL